MRITLQNIDHMDSKGIYIQKFVVPFDRDNVCVKRKQVAKNGGVLLILTILTES